MVFETLFCLGLLGFIAMSLMGMFHGHGHGGHADASHHGPVGHHSGGAHHADMGHHGHGVGHGHGHGHGHHSHNNHDHSHGDGLPALKFLFMFLSPINIFGIALGIGATGLLLRGRMELLPLWILAAVVGLIFNFGVLGSIFRLAVKFSSKPSEGLEGCVGASVEAVSNFDSSGKGLVKVKLDDEFVQVLAALPLAEVESGIKVRKGESVTILDVNSTKGICSVTKEIS